MNYTTEQLKELLEKATKGIDIKLRMDSAYKLQTIAIDIAADLIAEREKNEMLRESCRALLCNIEYLIEEGTLPNEANEHPAMTRARAALALSDAEQIEEAKRRG